jgi:FtsZ-binding cell division protein ZapB
MRDYTDMMNMAPAELVRHALDCAKVGILSIALVEALAIQLETQAAEAVQADRLREELEEAEQRATMWQEECRALQRQMDRTYG